MEKVNKTHYRLTNCDLKSSLVKTNFIFIKKKKTRVRELSPRKAMLWELVFPKICKVAKTALWKTLES